MSAARSPSLLFFALALAGFLPGSGELAAQEQETCPSGVVSRIEVDPHRIFEPEESGEVGALRLYFGLMNAIHITTRESLIRSELFFREGDCFDPFLLDESERVLRALEFIRTADVTEEVQADGSHAVQVVTADAVSIKLSLGVTFDDGFTFENVGISEINLLGRGITLGAFRREQREILERGVEFATPRMFGKPIDARLVGGATRDGTFLRQSVFLPFINERSRFAARQAIDWSVSPFAYAVTPGEGYSHVLLPVDRFQAELTSAFRWGEESSLFWLGGGLSWEGLDSDHPEGVEVVRDKDFKNPASAPDSVPDVLASQVSPQNATRIHLMAARRNIVFDRRRRLDAVDAVQDVRVGTEIVATVAPSLGILEIGDHPTDDVYYRLEAFGGGGLGELFWTLNGSIEARRVGEQVQDDGGRWKDVITELAGVLFWQPSLDLVGGEPGRHTFLLRASWDQGRYSTRPFQLTLGGRDAVRGYSRDAFPGAGRLILTAEHRPFLGWPRTQLFDVGASFFLDVGRMWAGDAPYGVDSGWKAAIGFGLRLATPAGSDRTTRIEFTLPFDRSAEADPTYFRFYVDLGGVLRGFKNEQLQRNRFSGVSSDLVNRPRREGR